MLAWAVISDDPTAMDKVKLFFDMFSQLPSWFTNLWILVVASIYGIKGTQIFKNGGKKCQSFLGNIANKIVQSTPRSKKVGLQLNPLNQVIKNINIAKDVTTKRIRELESALKKLNLVKK